MSTSIIRLTAAVISVIFVVAACASDTGAQWTYAPVAVSEQVAPAAVSEPVVEVEVAEADSSEDLASDAETETQTTEAQAIETETTGTTEAETTETTEEEVTETEVAEAGEARVIDMQADGALRFTDASGEQIQDIPVTPGETVVFRIDNTAGFDHNFYIGLDAELITPSGSTDTGIPTWATGVQELEWTVPDDLTDLKFGCTVPGHYTLMQGTFSVSP